MVLILYSVQQHQLLLKVAVALVVLIVVHTKVKLVALVVVAVMTVQLTWVELLQPTTEVQEQDLLVERATMVLAEAAEVLALVVEKEELLVSECVYYH
jgi:hypothetical protein